MEEGHIVKRQKGIRRFGINECFPYLAEDIIFKILLWLSAVDVFGSARLVCRNWYGRIHSDSFINEHAHRSPTGILIQYESDKTVFVAMKSGKIDISNMRLVNHPVLSSCNGLVLVTDHVMPTCCRQLRIVNPATNWSIPAPLVPSYVEWTSDSCYTILAYAADCSKYKLVHTFNYLDRYNSPDEIDYGGCAILTIGVANSWRYIYFDNLTCGCKYDEVNSHPVMTQGYIHWSFCCDNLMSDVLTLNVETETLRMSKAPQVRQRYPLGGNVLLPMGCDLSLVVCSDESSWEVWRMSSESGVWTLLANIHLEAQLSSIGILDAVGWLKPAEVLLFRSRGKMSQFIAYDFHKQEAQFFELELEAARIYLDHVNTLLTTSDRLKLAHVQQEWTPPSPPYLKLNTCGFHCSAHGTAGGGGIIRDATGSVIMAYTLQLSSNSNMESEVITLESEADAILRGLQICIEHGFKQVEMEIDSNILKQSIDGSRICLWDLQKELQIRILLRKFGPYPVKCCKGEENRVATQLSRWGAIHGTHTFTTLSSLPPSISSLIQQDLPISNEGDTS